MFIIVFGLLRKWSFEHKEQFKSIREKGRMSYASIHSVFDLRSLYSSVTSIVVENQSSNSIILWKTTTKKLDGDKKEKKFEPEAPPTHVRRNGKCLRRLLGYRWSPHCTSASYDYRIWSGSRTTYPILHANGSESMWQVCGCWLAQ